jgi:Fic family protein
MRALFGDQLNDRQRLLLTRALKDPDAVFTYESHANSHGVTLPTARTDLLELQRYKLLTLNRKGRAFRFHVVPDLEERLRKLAKRKR